MRLGLQDMDWAYVGAKLAQGDDTEQVDFLKGFIKECRSWGTRNQIESQLAMVNHQLTPDDKSVLRMLGYDAELDERR